MASALHLRELARSAHFGEEGATEGAEGGETGAETRAETRAEKGTEGGETEGETEGERESGTAGGAEGKTGMVGHGVVGTEIVVREGGSNEAEVEITV